MNAPDPLPTFLAYVAGAALGAASALTACAATTQCPRAGAYTWEYSDRENTCDYTVQTAPNAGCLQVGYLIADCRESFRYQCANGIQKIVWYDTAELRGGMKLTDPNGCATYYALVIHE